MRNSYQVFSLRYFFFFSFHFSSYFLFFIFFSFLDLVGFVSLLNFFVVCFLNHCLVFIFLFFLSISCILAKTFVKSGEKVRLRVMSRIICLDPRMKGILIVVPCFESGRTTSKMMEKSTGFITEVHAWMEAWKFEQILFVQ